MIALPNMFSARKTAEIKICGLSITQSSNGVLKTATPPRRQAAVFRTFALPDRTAAEQHLSDRRQYEIKQLKDNPTCEYAGQGHILTE